MSRGHSKDQGPLDCKVYVGGLGEEASRHELWDAFEKYGSLKNVWVARNPPGFAFVEFMDRNDAADAVEQLDQRSICGRRVTVELSTGESRKNRSRPRTDQCCYECGRPGHLARDCQSRGRYSSGGSGGRYSSSSYSSRRSRSRSPERRRSPSRSRSRSPVRRGRSRSRSGSYNRA